MGTAELPGPWVAETAFAGTAETLTGWLAALSGVSMPTAIARVEIGGVASTVADGVGFVGAGSEAAAPCTGDGADLDACTGVGWDAGADTGAGDTALGAGAGLGDGTGGAGLGAGTGIGTG